MPTKEYLSLAIKLILAISIINSIYNGLWHIASTNLFLLILLFSPQALKKYSQVKIPKEFEIFLLVFVLITLFLGQFSAIFAPIFFGIGVGIIALLIMFILYSSREIKRNYFLITFFSFSFALTFGVILELFKYYLKKILGHTLDSSIYTFTMDNLSFVLVGALIASFTGFLYLKTRFRFIGDILNMIVKSNPDLFKRKTNLREIIEEIKEGEGERQELKSTLRTNLFTNQIDKKMERGVLKSICGFLNSNGGVLYIGVTDEKKILGIEKDNFENTDRFHLHLTNLIKQKIGKRHLSLINSEVIDIGSRQIMRIEIKKSKSPIFLNQGQEELFFMRTGAQTIELRGSELVDYIKKRFEKK